MWTHSWLVALLFSVLNIDALAGTIYVDQSNPHCPGSGTAIDPFCVIQDAIGAAHHGDLVEVAPGSYLETINFLGKAIEVMSRDGAVTTKLQPFGFEPTVVFWSGEDARSVLRGFTVEAHPTGVLVAQHSHPVIRDNIFEQSLAIDVRTDAHPTIQGNTFVASEIQVGAVSTVPTVITDNLLDGSGILVINQSSVIVERNTLRGRSIHTSNGIALQDLSTAFVRENLFEGCIAETITVSHSTLVATNNLFADNEAEKGGAVHLGYWSNAYLSDNVFVGNSAGSGSAVYVDWYAIKLTVENCTFHANGDPTTAVLHAESTTPVTVKSSIFHGNGGPPISAIGALVTYSDVEGGYPGTGNIDADPLFRDASRRDLRLGPGSPCLESGDPARNTCEEDRPGNPRVLDGNFDLTRRVDMGAFEFEHVRLSASGAPTPGGTLTLETTGTAGLPVILFVALDEGQLCHHQLGPFFFDFAGTWFLVPLGSIPSTAAIPIPLDVPTPLPVIFQELALALPAGNTSNPARVTIE